VYPHRIDWINRVPVACKAAHEVVPCVSEEPLKLECGQFLSSMKTRKDPLTDGEEGLRVLKILAAFQESLNGNGETVMLGNAEKPYFVHPSSYVDEGAVIGDKTTVWHFSHILKGSRIGSGCRIGQNVVIGPHVTVGSGCKIQNNVSIYEGVTLEDGVFCGPSMVFTNVINPRSAVPRMHELQKTVVRQGATIGANATIVCGHEIGRYAFIGAGAVVTRDVPDHALVTGNPARISGWMCECGMKLGFGKADGSGTERAVCASCGKTYGKRENMVREIVKEGKSEYAHTTA
jgi:UDP-2-acetamido-3-amino-2,3-dideoxy-glucuronate N-acetyltransferase